jgi:O-acetylserine/cysteine efflux transporter
MSFSTKDYFYILLVIIIWAGNVIAIKMAVTELPPLTAATLRFAAAALIFLPFIKMPGRSTLWNIFQISMFMNVLHIGTLFIALKMLDAASVSILLQTQVVFATILGLFFFGEKIKWRTWTGIGFAVFGLIIMLGEPDLASHPQGMALMLFSTLALAFSYVKMKHLQTVHPATYICLMSLFAVPFAFAGTLILEPGSWQNQVPETNWSVFGSVLAYQAVLVSLTHIFWQRLMHRGDVGKISAFTLLIPFFAVILSVIFLGEHIAWPMIVGGIVTMLGVGIITLRRIQKGIA